MLTLSAAAKLEKNALSDGGAWLVLLEINLTDGTILRVCDNTEDVWWPAIKAPIGVGLGAGELPIIGKWAAGARALPGVYLAASQQFRLANAAGAWDAPFLFNPFAGAPLAGDWQGTGSSRVGVVAWSAVWSWALDWNGNRAWDGGDHAGAWGGNQEDIPFVGDWDGDGKDTAGIWRPSDGTWYLDVNGNFAWDAGVDLTIPWGTGALDVPVIGDWNGDGTTKVGVWRASDGNFYNDVNGDHTYQVGEGFHWPAPAGGVPVLGDWNGDGTTKCGLWVGGRFYLDYDGSHVWANRVEVPLGEAGDTPLVGDWDGDGKDEVGVYRPDVGFGLCSGTAPAYLWQRFPFQLEPLRQTAQGEIPSLTLKIANATRVVQSYLEQGKGGIGATVRLRVVHSEHLDLATPELDETFDVVASSADAQWVSIVLGAPNPLTSRCPRHRYLRDHCRWTFKSAECGYVGAETSCARTRADCMARSNTLRFGGFPGIPGGALYAV